MLFWPIAVIALVAIIVAQLNATFPNALQSDGAGAKLIYLSLLLTIILIFSFRRRRVRLKPAAMMGLGWLAVFAALLVAYTYRDEARMVFERVRGEVNPTIAIAQGEGEVEIRKAWDGHFRAQTQVNGATIAMLIDTGASVVLLTYEDAAAAGLEPETLAFTQPVATANGRAHVAAVTLPQLAVGVVTLGRVRAAVAEEGKLRTSLLGMSFLGRLRETSFRGDRLILKN
ncbi:MAG: TIGR02281 family clan AA aspartic protease [Paracoccaceae bacterium]